MAGGPPAESFGELLRRLRFEARLTQEELAEAAQAMIKQNQATLRRPATRSEYLLGQGLLRCGTVLDNGEICGKVMCGETHHGVAYRCNHSTPSGMRRHQVPARVVEERVWAR